MHPASLFLCAEQRRVDGSPRRTTLASLPSRLGPRSGDTMRCAPLQRCSCRLAAAQGPYADAAPRNWLFSKTCGHLSRGPEGLTCWYAGSAREGHQGDADGMGAAAGARRTDLRAGTRRQRHRDLRRLEPALAAHGPPRQKHPLPGQVCKPSATQVSLKDFHKAWVMIGHGIAPDNSLSIRHSLSVEYVFCRKSWFEVLPACYATAQHLDNVHSPN